MAKTTIAPSTPGRCCPRVFETEVMKLSMRLKGVRVRWGSPTTGVTRRLSNIVINAVGGLQAHSREGKRAFVIAK